MMYNVLSPERAHTRPSRFAGKRRTPAAHPVDRAHGEVMTFSVDALPGWSDERGSVAPVYVADRNEPVRSYQAAPAAQITSSFDTARIRTISREGMRASTALLLAVVMLMATGVIWLAYRIQIGEVAREIDGNRVKIATLEAQAEGISQSIVERTTDISIAEMARDMGMIYSRSQNSVYLTAPENAVCTPYNDTVLASGYLASILGD